MKIYTKTGDGGQTSLFGGKRVEKDVLRIEAYGTVDELNSVLGVVRTHRLPDGADAMLDRIQRELFALGSDLATPPAPDSGHVRRMTQDEISRLEQDIDRLDESLQPLKAFILPGGSPAGAQTHVARTVCRRAERIVTTLIREEHLDRMTGVYLNRLSDLLFVLARAVNRSDAKPESEWHSR